jgi:hypothetical protein
MTLISLSKIIFQECHKFKLFELRYWFILIIPLKLKSNQQLVKFIYDVFFTKEFVLFLNNDNFFGD